MGAPVIQPLPDPTNNWYPGGLFYRLTWPDGRWIDLQMSHIWGQNIFDIAASFHCKANTGAAPGQPGHPSPYPGFPRPNTHPTTGSASPDPGNSIPLPDGSWFTPNPGTNPGPILPGLMTP